MPFFIKKVLGGFKVVDINNKEYSKKPLTRLNAIKQMQAIIISERKSKNKI